MSAMRMIQLPSIGIRFTLLSASRITYFLHLYIATDRAQYQALKDIINAHVKKEEKVLIVGCGNSLLTEEMYADGYLKITNIDISKVVISQMKEKYASNKALKWICMDVAEMEFEDCSFNAVIDKGTLDSILCGEESTEKSAKMCREVSRVLVPRGTFISFSFGVPVTRKYMLQSYCAEWAISAHAVTDSPAPSDALQLNLNFAYICQKKPPGPESKIDRVLMPGGTFIDISYGVPDTRLCVLEGKTTVNWEVNVVTIPKPDAGIEPESVKVHYAYICSKMRTEPEENI